MMTALVFRLNTCLRDSSSTLKSGSFILTYRHFARDSFPQTNGPVSRGVLVESLRDGSCSCSFDANRRIEVRKTLSKIYRPISLAEPSHLSNDGFSKPRGSNRRPLSHNAALPIEASKDSLHDHALGGV